MAIFRWFRRRHQELDLLGEYFRLVFTRWQSLLWGGSALAVGWGLRFLVGEWPPWVNWMAVFIALLFAGYYVWRVDHVQLIPRLKLGEVRKFAVRANDGSERLFVQIPVKCGSSGHVEDCQGHVIAVSRWSADNKYWETLIDEGLPVLWGNIDQPSCKIWPGIIRPLNILYIDNVIGRIVLWDGKGLNWVTDVFDKMIPSDVLKFDVLVTAHECAPMNATFKVELAEKWNELILN